MADSLKITIVIILFWIVAVLALRSAIPIFWASTMPRSWRIPAAIGAAILVLFACGIVLNDGTAEEDVCDLMAGAMLILFSALCLFEVSVRWTMRKDREWRDAWRREHDEHYSAMMDWVDSQMSTRSFQVLRWFIFPFWPLSCFWLSLDYRERLNGP